MQDKAITTRTLTSIGVALALAAGAAGAQDRGAGDFGASMPYEQYLSDSDLRASELIGAMVRNHQGQELGEIDDLVVSRDDDVITAVINVGGFLGLAEKPIGVPYEELRVSDDGDTLYLEATVDQLEARPEFHYDSRADVVPGEPGQQRQGAAQQRERAGERGAAPEPIAGAATEPDAARAGQDAERTAQAGGAAAAGGQAARAENVETMDRGAHRASNLIGLTVVDSDGDEVGEIDDVVIAGQDEPLAVLSLGGVLGVGDTLIAVPLMDLTIEQAESEQGAERVRLATTAQQLIDAEPEFRYELTASLDRESQALR